MLPGTRATGLLDSFGDGWLGKYQLIRRLATGGMAELFLARTSAIHGFEKLVVLKRILPQHAESEDFIRMFLAEARLAATLHHPNIVQVYDIGEEDGRYFFTMEYVQGQDLRRLVRAARKKQQPIPLEHILHVIMGIAGGLHHAHEKAGLDGRPLGIVHRDVSPSNVLVTFEGDVKIVDFGIAKAATAQVSTIAGTLKGKIPYMSPEQCRGEAVDCRSDIFSIGTLLWELTTGRRLFAGDNEFAILNRVAKGDVPFPSSIRPEYPPELEAIVMRALQADPEDRYSNAVDLQIDLEDFAREARLPVSSARLGRFMRVLFEEELAKAKAEVQAEQARLEAGDRGGTMIVSPSSPIDGVEAADLTPSEVRHFGGDPTPGLVQENSGTDIALAPVPKRVSTGSMIAIGAGFVATLGVASMIYMSGGDDDTDAKPVASPTEVRVIESAVEPDPDSAGPDARKPNDSGAVLVDDESAGGLVPPVADSADAADTAEAGDPADASDTAIEIEDTAVGDGDDGSDANETPDTPPVADDDPPVEKPKVTKRRPRTPKKPTTKPATPPPKPPKPKPDRPKYDPNTAIMPGFGGGKK